MPLGPLQEAWVKALESGEFQQGQGRLATILSFDDDGEPEAVGYCCLGVLCELEGLEKAVAPVAGGEAPRYAFGSANEQFYILPNLVEKYGFHNRRAEPKDKDDFYALALLNDQGRTFEEIARVIREHPEQYFTKVV